MLSQRLLSAHRILLLSIIVVVLALLAYKVTVDKHSNTQSIPLTAQQLADPILLAVSEQAAAPSSFLVHFTDDFAKKNHAEQRDYLTTLGVQVERRFIHIGHVAEVSLVSDTVLHEALSQLRQSPFIKTAEANYWIDAASQSNSPEHHAQLAWGLHNMGQTGGRLDADIDAPEAWDKYRRFGQPSHTPVVAVLDSHINTTRLNISAHVDIESPLSLCRSPNNQDAK